MPTLHVTQPIGVSKTGGQRALVYRDSYLSWRGLQHRVQRRAPFPLKAQRRGPKPKAAAADLPKPTQG